MEEIKYLNPYEIKGNGATTPVKLTGNIEEEQEGITLESFLETFPEFRNIFYDKGQLVEGRYTSIFKAYNTLGKKVITSDIYEDSTNYCISLYIAHYLQLSIDRTKNINNVSNLNTTKASDTVNNNEGGKGSKGEDLDKTEYGKILKTFMRALSNSRIRGVY